VTNVGFTSVNLGSKFDFKFSLKKALNIGDSIKFNLPAGFYFVQPACFHRNSGTYAIAEALYNNRMVICKNFQTSMATDIWHEVTIIGVVNPQISGFYRYFTLETMEGVTTNVKEFITAPTPIEISPGSITVGRVSGSILLMQNTTHQFDIIPENEIPDTAQLWIKLPAGFRYLAPNCTLLRPLAAADPNGFVSCGLAENKTGYIIEGFAGIAAKQSISVLINAENPPKSTTYRIQVFSYSKLYQAKIDEAFHTMSFDSRCN